MLRFLIVCAGGAVGTGARYLTVLWAAAMFGSAFPIGTLVVNVAGSLLLGFVMHIGTATELLSANARLALTTGVMGGFTTYSTFNYESTEFFRGGAWLYGSLNIVVTVVTCLVAGLAGLALARVVVGR